MRMGRLLASLVAVLFLAAVPGYGQVTDIALGTPTDGTLTSSADVHHYRIAPALTSGQHVIGLYERSAQWDGYLAIRFNSVTAWPIQSASGDRDLVVEAIPIEAGYYYLEVHGGPSVTYPLSYTVTGLTAYVLPTLTLGTPQAGQSDGFTPSGMATASVATS